MFIITVKIKLHHAQGCVQLCSLNLIDEDYKLNYAGYGRDLMNIQKAAQRNQQSQHHHL